MILNHDKAPDDSLFVYLTFKQAIVYDLWYFKSIFPYENQSS